jgi:hypothetical protein
MNPLLCIISVYRPDLMAEACDALGVVGNVDVIMDRRVGERRAPDRAGSEESRLRDRRRRSLDEDFRTDGFVVVQRDDDPARP